MKVQLDASLKNELVEAAEKIADKAAESTGGGASQIRNMIQICQSESEIPVLKNFIEYQSGRKSTRKFWAPIVRKDPAERNAPNAVLGVLDVLDLIEQRTGNAEVRKAALLAFFGYMVRRYVYRTVGRNDRTED